MPGRMGVLLLKWKLKCKFCSHSPTKLERGSKKVSKFLFTPYITRSSSSLESTPMRLPTSVFSSLTCQTTVLSSHELTVSSYTGKLKQNVHWREREAKL